MVFKYIVLKWRNSYNKIVPWFFSNCLYLLGTIYFLIIIHIVRNNQHMIILKPHSTLVWKGKSLWLHGVGKRTEFVLQTHPVCIPTLWNSWVPSFQTSLMYQTIFGRKYDLRGLRFEFHLGLLTSWCWNKSAILQHWNHISVTLWFHIIFLVDMSKLFTYM